MRLIPNLLINNSYLTKNVSFKRYKYLGDPVNAAKIYFEKGADEILLMDNSAYKNGINLKLIDQITSNCFIPITYAGNVKDIADIKKLLNSGVERIAVGVYKPKDWDRINEFTKFLGGMK